MGGCTNCGSKAGCDHRKGAMMSSIDDALDRLYPSRTWGEIDDDAREGLATVEDRDIAALADELATELGTATFVRPGGDDEPCDYIYVLCLGRPPCLVQVRDAGVEVPREWREAWATGGVHEQYLRVCVSRLAPVAGVQQVAMDLLPAPEPDHDGFVIRETPRAGVYDAPLLRRFQRLVAILPAYDLLHLDFGDISAPPPGFTAGAWRDLFGGEPAVANYFFYPQPATSPVTTWIPA
jgi:hypothetical protein